MKKKKKTSVRILAALLALLAFGLMAMGSGSGEDPSEKIGERETVSSSGTGNPAETADKTEFRVGETFENRSFRIIFLSAGEYESDNPFSQPKEGYQFVYIRLFFENRSGIDQIVSYFDFECYADGYACDPMYTVEDSLSATLSKGRTTEGCVCFEVPEGAGSVEFEYEISSLTDKKIRFLYNGPENSGIVPETDVKPTEGAYEVGDIIESKSERITYLSSGEYLAENWLEQPEEGYTILFIELEVENLSAGDESISSLFFRCYADGAACRSSLAEDDDLSATLSQGRKTKGKVYFEVPENAKIVEIEYDNIGTAKICFRVR